VEGWVFDSRVAERITAGLDKSVHPNRSGKKKLISGFGLPPTAVIKNQEKNNCLHHID